MFGPKSDISISNFRAEIRTFHARAQLLSPLLLPPYNSDGDKCMVAKQNAWFCHLQRVMKKILSPQRSAAPAVQTGQRAMWAVKNPRSSV
jgi:hypothetical protein